MKEQEYNNLIHTLSNALAPINQLLYEILVISALYIYLERIQSNSLYISNNSLSVIIIFTIFALGIDWYLWCNPIQTILFGAILIIYIRYKLSNIQLISSFVNMTGVYADAAVLKPEDSIDSCQHAPSIPEMVDLPYDTTNVKPYGIMAYDKNESSINSIQDAYKSDQPLATITDSSYANMMLNELYQTPQYRNNHPPNEIDSSLANDIHKSVVPNSLDTSKMSDEELLKSFRHPKREFIDNKWLSIPGNGTYNDNNLCKNNTSNIKLVQNKNKDAICNLAQFGKKLEQCTNQEYSVSVDQLDKISSNDIPYDDF
jgi:hypothetical protein